MVEATMASAAQQLECKSDSRSGHGRLLVPVIADRGDAAAVVLVEFSRLPRVGDRFQQGGRDWEITRDKDHARTFVARPVRRRR